MKRIWKHKAPDWFESWKDDFKERTGREPEYEGDFASDDKRRRRLRKDLIQEQGYICCYCLSRIHEDGEDKAHTEHFWPKYYFPQYSLDYVNLLASCEGDPEPLYADYCGHRKDNWYDSHMVSPADSNMEGLFRYLPDGTIQAAEGKTETSAAKEMIDHLGLNSFHLIRNRLSALQGSEVYEDGYSQEDIRDIINYYDHMDNGTYVPYCQAIIDCLISYYLQ